MLRHISSPHHHQDLAPADQQYFVGYATANREDVQSFATSVVKVAQLVGALGALALAGLAATSMSSSRGR